MALTKEDLLAISQLLDMKLKTEIQVGLQPLKDEMQELKGEVQELKGLKDEVEVLKTSIRNIELHLENVTDRNIQNISGKLHVCSKTV